MQDEPPSQRKTISGQEQSRKMWFLVSYHTIQQTLYTPF